MDKIIDRERNKDDYHDQRAAECCFDQEIGEIGDVAGGVLWSGSFFHLLCPEAGVKQPSIAALCLLEEYINISNNPKISI
ncbi:MAG: hypothetical protein GY855_01980 [candidate division Zixibacteria bacterium]|nr:hypothetical protein [candidate division Zixibacteria bacterium]